jgi:hypothetical protein
VDLIWTILAGIGAVIGAAFAKLAADEFKAWMPRLINAVVQCAIRMLREDQRDRYAEEWRSHIDETPGEIGKLFVGLGLLLAAWNLSRASPIPRAHQDHPQAHQIEAFVTTMRDALWWTRHKFIVRLLTVRGATKRLHRLDPMMEVFLHDPQMLNEMNDLVQRLAAEEPGDSVMRKWAADIENAEREGFERGYRESAGKRNVEPSELAAARANARTRRQAPAAGHCEPDQEIG